MGMRMRMEALGKGLSAELGDLAVRLGVEMGEAKPWHAPAFEQASRPRGERSKVGDLKLLINGGRVVLDCSKRDAEIFLAGMMAGRLTCPCPGCRDHNYWVRVREDGRRTDAKKGKGARKKAGPHRRA